MSSFNAAKCKHIKTNGVQCASPALRDKRYCYYHQRSRPVLVNLNTDSDPRMFSVPPFEDVHAIQFALRQVAIHYLNGNFDEKKTGLMLYALQIASCNLRLMAAEPTQPEQVVSDIPQLSEMPRPEPLPEPIQLNSDTNHKTHFPESPTPEDEYYDDRMRQSREIREAFAFQILDAKQGKKPEAKQP